MSKPQLHLVPPHITRPKRPLTPRQREVLQFIRWHIVEQGWPPTIREIAGAVRVSSTNAVVDHLHLIEKKGYLELGASGGSRQIRPVVSIPGRVDGRLEAVAHDVFDGIFGGRDRAWDLWTVCREGADVVRLYRDALTAVVDALEDGQGLEAALRIARRLLSGSSRC